MLRFLTILITSFQFGGSIIHTVQENYFWMTEYMRVVDEYFVTLQVRSKTECLTLCLNNSNCRSLNFKRGIGSELRNTCELFDKDYTITCMINDYDTCYVQFSDDTPTTKFRVSYVTFA